MAIETISLPIPSLGLDKYNAPIFNQRTTPNVKNMNITPTVVKKRAGTVELGLNLPLSGVGMECLQYIDAFGEYHTIAITTTNAYEFDGSTKTWSNITPSLVIEDCEDVWVGTAPAEGDTIATDSTVTAGIPPLQHMLGSKSVKITLVAERVDGKVLAHEDFDAIDISSYTHIGFWIKSSIILAAEALELVVSEAANGAKTGTVNEDYAIALTTAIAADTWTFVQVEMTDLTDLSAIISVALFANTSIATATVIHIDDVRAYTPFTEKVTNRWSYGMCYDSNNLFANNGGAAMIFSNDVDAPFYFEGDAGDTMLSLDVSDWTTFATVKEVIEFWNHLIFANYTDTARRAKQVAEADLGDANDWTTGTSNAHFLTDSVGALLRAIKLKASLIMYSEGTITICNYVGSPNIFVFPTLVYDSGLWAERGIYAFNEFHVLLGTDQKIYKYEGRYYLDPIGERIEDAFFQEADPLKAAHIVAGTDPLEHRLHFAFANSTDTYAKRSYALNYKQKPMTWEYHEFPFYIRGFSKYKNEYGWYADGPELAGTFADEWSFFADESRTQEGAPVAIVITDTGYVYQFSGTAGQDAGTDIECVLDSNDIVAENDEYLKVTEFSFEAMSSVPLATCNVYYSTDGGKTWPEANKIASISVSDGAANTWTWHRIPEDQTEQDLDITARMIRFRILQDSNKDLQIRRRCVRVEMGSRRS